MKQPGSFAISSLLFNFSSLKSSAVSLLLCASLVTGLYASLNIIRLFLGVEDPDSLHSLMLWQGVREHGLLWLADWRYTQDNWLLSLVPLHFIGFALFGTSHMVTVIGGWLIFVASAVTCASIAWTLGAKRAAICILLLLLNFGMYAHVYGFVSYSTSHNITNLYGLIGVLLLLRWILKPRRYHLFLLFFVLACGVISDPWMLPAFNLPILLMAVIFFCTPGISIGRAQAAKIGLVSALSIVAVETKLFGFFFFLPDVEFALADWSTMLANTGFVFRDIGGLFDLVPVPGMNDFLPGLLSITALAVLLAYSLFGYFFLGARKTAHHALLAFMLVVFFSVGGTALAAIVSAVAANDNTARFVINIAYLLIVLIAILLESNWESSSKFLRAGAATIFTLFVVSGLNSSSALIAFYEGVVTPQVEPIIAQLRRDGLAYGYGSYWDPAPVNSITAASNFELRVRPVVFNPASCRIEFERAQSSRRWYLEEDVPQGTEEFFVMLDSNQDQCLAGSNFSDGLIAQFGEVVRSFEFGEVRVFVWDHKLIDYVHPINISPGQTVDFSNAGEAPNGSGWSESESWGTWSVDDVAELQFNLVAYNNGPLEIRIRARAFLTAEDEPKIIQVSVNGLQIGQLNYVEQTRVGIQNLLIPASIIEDLDNKLLIRFQIPDLQSPAELGTSADARRLGIGLVSISFR